MFVFGNNVSGEGNKPHQKGKLRMKKVKDLVAIGLRIADERDRLGWQTQEEAGMNCGVTREMWGKYERGANEMGKRSLDKFVSAGADLDYLLTGVRKKRIEVGHTTVDFGGHSLLETNDDEQVLIKAYRLAQKNAQQAMLGICRMLPMADEHTVCELAHTVCKSIAQKIPVVLVTDCDVMGGGADFDDDEQLLAKAFRSAPSQIRRVILAAADCPDEHAGVEQLIQCYRSASTSLRKSIRAAADWNRDQNRGRTKGVA
jgi:transcriptional regulator with XRE-family HTH domain